MWNKQERFSIRKIKGVIGSVIVGSVLVAPYIAEASTFHYIDSSQLSSSEKSKIREGSPDESEDSYVLIYEKSELPNTGVSNSILTSFGLLTVGSLILLVSKKKRLFTFFLVTSIGLISLNNGSALDLTAPIRLSGSDGVVKVEGYYYLGYIPISELNLPQVQEFTSVLSTDNVVKPQESLGSSLEEVSNVSSQQSPSKNVEKPIVSDSNYSIEMVKDGENPVVSVSSVIENSTNSSNVSVKTEEKFHSDKGEPLVQPSLPEYIVTEKGTPKVQPPLKEYVFTEKGEPEVQPALQDVVISEKGDPEVRPELSEAVVSEKGESLVQPALSEAIVSEKGVPEVQPSLPEFREEKGYSLVQPENPVLEIPKTEEPKVEVPKTEVPISENSKIEPKVELPKIDAPKTDVPKTEVPTSESPRTSQPSSESSQKLDEPKKDDSSTPVAKEGNSSIESSKEGNITEGVGEVPKVDISKSDEKPATEETPKTEPSTVENSMKPEKTEELKKEIEKQKPVLKFQAVSEDVLSKSATVNYTLENQDNATITSIVATIKEGDKVVKTIDLKTENLSKVLENLDYFKDYTISTVMKYDLGKGEEVSTLEDKPLRLELKKVELKNIASTNLMKVEEDGTETISDFMSDKPSEEDVKKMYLKITSRDNKITRLAVNSIEEVTEEGKKLYKITAEAKDLIQHTDPTKVRNKYVHYIEKPVPKVNNVYYNFNELVRDMQEHPNGEFKLGADLNATNVSAFGKSYVTKDFKGKLLSDGENHYTIHNLSRPLFGNVIGGTVTKINLGNVNINMPWADRIAPIADTIKGGAKIEDVKVAGNVLGKNWVSGFIDKIDSGGTLRNVAFIGNVTSIGTGSSFLTGIVGENWKGLVEQAYVDANIRGKKAKAAGIAYWSQNSGNNHTVGREGAIKKSVVKGTIDVEEPIEVGGAVGSLNMHGSIEDSVSMMKVENGEIFYGSHDISDDPYWTGNNVNRNYVVKDVSKGTSSYKHSKELGRIKPITQEEADKKIKELSITADKYAITEPIVNKLNALTTRDNEYNKTQDYDSTREQAYRNIEKLQPFYNKEWIVNQGNKLVEGSNLLTKEVLSVTGIKNGRFVTDLSDIDKIMIHYADGTKEEMNVTSVADSKVKQVREYSIDGLDDVVYTPNMVVKNRDKLITDVKAQLSSVKLISQEVRALMDKRDTSRDPNANSDERKNGYIKDLFLEESFAEVKANLGTLVKHMLENEDHQLNDNELAERALLKKVEDNKAKIMMGLAYLNQYYGFKYGELSIKDIMMFKPDFYGKNVNVLDFLIKVGSKENNIKGDRTLEAYRETIGGTIGINELNGFLHYNMKLFTNHTDINDWFKKAIEKNAYVVEQPSTNPAFANKKYRLYEGINNGQHGRMILPLLNLKNAHLFMISTYNTISFSSFEKYGKDTAEKREAFKSEINKRAKEQVNYLDFWSRLATDNVRDKLLKSQNGVPTPVWDNHNAPDGWPDRFGHRNGKPDYTPVREFFGRIGKYHPYQYGYGAYAYIFAAPQPMDAVYFVMTDLISDFGTSAFTHETTHVNDRMVYYGGYWHRQGTDLEAFAQGMLQTPDKSTTNGEYGALGINMAYHRPNDGNQWYNPDPDKLQTRDQIDHYMKNYNEAMMMLDYAEAEAVLPKVKGDNSKWFKKIDREIRRPMDRNKLSGPHQWDKVRVLTDAERITPLNTIDDLVNNNFMTIHGNPGNGRYRPEDFTPNSAYVNVNMMAGIYGGNTSDGAPGSLSFKHNAFRMWGYYGYENGFISYVSNKYKAEADKNNHGLLSDKLIINKVSKGNFNTLEEWKRHWYEEVLAKAKKGFEGIDIDGVHISNYDELRPLFDKAVEEDLKKTDDFSHTVALKSKVFKALLKNTDGFFNQLFKKDI